jgi:hypothetical protein
MTQEIVLIPVGGPRQVHEQHAHLKTEQYQQYLKKTIHQRAEPVLAAVTNTDRLLDCHGTPGSQN